jgi:hypothetical protein
MNRKLWFRFALVISLIIISAGIYLKHAYSYLNFTQRVEPDILVVEGWLSEDALESAKQEFLRNSYNLLITTGFPYKNGWLMGVNGFMEFDVQGRLGYSPSESYEITLTVTGTRAKGQFAHFSLYADSTLVGQDYSTRRSKKHTYRISADRPPTTIKVIFDNDLHKGFQDRNLFVYAVKVNNETFRADNKSVTCYIKRRGGYFIRQPVSRSTATRAAEFMVHSGIPHSLVVPVETTRKLKSKTYTSGLDVRNWLETNGPVSGRRSITIVTLGAHARRSYYSFKKVFGNQADIGVISLPYQDMNYYNWWKNPLGWETILYESLGLIYISICL